MTTYGGGRWLSYRSSPTSSDFNRLDRFGRTKSQVWDNGGFPASLYDQVDYTYDFAGNRLTRNVVATTNDTRDQKYVYDGLHRLLSYDQGTLAGGSITGSNQQRYWEMDQLGNWPKLRNGLTLTSPVLEERTHNAVNELTGFTSPGTYIDPQHDLAGNMTSAPSPLNPASSILLKYDAWNRLIEVRDGANVVQTLNEYDDLGRRIVRDPVGSANTVDDYYNDQWQLLTEVKNGAVDAIYQWHPYYIDALNLRMRSSDMHWFTHDANYNVTAVIDDTANVLERYSYTPYGEVTYLEPDFDVDVDQISDIANNHLYTGRERDPETGLQLNRERYYAPNLGRWINRDPISYDGSSYNLYQYVGSQPSDFGDPHGLSDIGWPSRPIREDFPPSPPEPRPPKSPIEKEEDERIFQTGSVTCGWMGIAGCPGNNAPKEF